MFLPIRFFVVLTLIALPSLQVSATRVIARVGQHVITDVALQSRKDLIKGDEQLTDETIDAAILDRLIVEKLLEDEAARLKISVSDQEVDGAMKDLAVRNSMEIDNFLSALENDGINQAVIRSQLRATIMWQKIVESVVAVRVQLQESEFLDFMQTKHPNLVLVQGFVFTSNNRSALEELRHLASESTTSNNDVLKNAFKQGIKHAPLSEPLSRIKRHQEILALRYSEVRPVAHDLFELIFVTGKTYRATDKAIRTYKNQLMMQKIESHAQKYLSDLKRVAHIEKYA